MTRILVTGSSGFVGGHLLSRLAEDGHDIAIATRSPLANTFGRAETIVVGGLGPHTDWSRALDGCDAVIHLAAQVPGRGVTPGDFDKVNNLGTARLTEQAFEAGVKLFVHLSSVLAVADNSSGAPVSGDTLLRGPGNPYGLSKLAAESHVASFSRQGRGGISIRAPLVYGWNAKGNWALLQRLAASGLPLPFAAVRNRRSLIAVDNLADAIATVVNAPLIDQERGGVYAVADSESVSLAELIGWLRQGMKRSPGLWAFPESGLRALLGAAGQGRVARSLLGDLEVDSSRFRAAFRWAPPLTAREAICASAERYLLERSV
ncbi:NAD-dependent epimerase/dehydratase family protein [Mesorhizobium sp. KR2-14]|uniref:NAD-dependent epimerase/dehydratase family protein n=1 Tax=Mesorhizobium sp. KR2-14 TaxID=3156610 RepID=UPI0032B5B2C1